EARIWRATAKKVVPFESTDILCARLRQHIKQDGLCSAAIAVSHEGVGQSNRCIIRYSANAGFVTFRRRFGAGPGAEDEIPFAGLNSPPLRNLLILCGDSRLQLR